MFLVPCTATGSVAALGSQLPPSLKLPSAEWEPPHLERIPLYPVTSNKKLAPLPQCGQHGGTVLPPELSMGSG